jgi:hypothetical protein
MNGHISEDLPRLLTGEASRDAVLDAAAHLRGCVDCQQELVAAVVAHASLTSAHRFASDIVERAAAEPPAEQQPGPLPDLSAVFAQIRAETAAPEPRSRRQLFAVAAVAAGLIVGAGATLVATNLDRSATPTGRTVGLAAYDAGHSAAQARIGDDRVTVDAASLPSLDSRHRYEVWLTNSGRTQMQPVGWIGTDGTATLTVPKSLLSSYSDIEVSIQQVDSASYVYSGTSVLRGSYGA